MRFLLVFLLLVSAKAEKLEITLNKGSRVSGETSLKQVKVDSGFGVLSIPVTNLVSISKHSSMEEVRLKNGSYILGRVQERKIPLKTDLGDFSVDLDKCKKIFVEKNKGLVSQPQWSEIVNGLGLRLISKKLSNVKDYKELKILVEVKNFRNQDILLPYPTIHEYPFEDYMECENPFNLKFIAERPSLVEYEGGLSKELMEDCRLSAGKSYTVEIIAKIFSDNQEHRAEQYALPDLSNLDGKKVELETEAHLKGEYEVNLSLSRFVQHKVWIVDPEGKEKVWTGLIELKPFTIKID